MFDSYSTDGTVAIAEAAGAKVTQRVFDNWAAHQNWGLANLPFKYPWVFYIDADERVTPELAQELLKAPLTAGDNVAFRVQRRDFLYGTWLKHVQASPFYMRLFRPEKMRYERLVNPISIVDGPVGELKGYLDHFPFSKGMSHWFDRHNKYSTLEAMQIVENRRSHAGAGRQPFSITSAFFEKDFHVRRFHQKELFYRMPMRPLVKFCVLYFLKRGFLDGSAGLVYATIASIYEYLIVLKTKELERGGA